MNRACSIRPYNSRDYIYYEYHNDEQEREKKHGINMLSYADEQHQ